MYFILLLVVIIRTCTDLSFKAGVHQLHFTNVSTLWPNLKQAFSRPYLWLGMIFGFSNVVVWVLSLQRYDLSYAYPFVSISYILIILGGKVIFKEHIDRFKLAGIICIGLGAAMLFL